jgi:methyl-accepting chemotaxis protein
MPLKLKLLAILGGILGIYILTLGFSGWNSYQQQAELSVSENASVQVADAAVPLLAAVKDIKVDVIQVQQWLTDISATRGLDGLNDGFDMAKEFAGKFAEDVASAREYATVLGLTSVVEALDKIKADFTPFYETGQKMAQAYVDEGPAGGNKTMGAFDEVAGQIYETTDALLTATVDSTNASLVGLKEMSVHLREENAQIILLLAACAALGLFLVLGSSAYLFLNISRSFNMLHRDVETALDINTNDEFLLSPDRSDEFGPVSAALLQCHENLKESTRLREQQEEAEQKGIAERKAIRLKMADEFESSVGQIVNQVSSASTELQSSSQSMTATAEQTTSQTAAVAAASEQASANVQMVASAAEELSSSISEISHQVATASQIAGAAVEEANETNAKIQGLAEAAQKIGEVVALITDIADQTNLLALNATIEAARAGDAGKGFAVVASEVKNLANQTAKATDEIGAQISGIQTSTKEAVEAIENIGKTISEIDEVASGIASAVEEQGAATQEIARNVEQAAAGTQEVSSNITGVNQAANDTGAAATEINSASGELSVQSETLRAEVVKFLENVRAA